jgi:hypothetical protein
LSKHNCQSTIAKLAARRGGARIQFFQNWESDIIFCNFNFKKIGIAKNDIVFAYTFAARRGKVVQLLPLAAASANIQSSTSQR